MGKKFKGRVIKVNPHKINEYIDVTHVRLVGDNVENNIYDTQTALKMAYDLGLDLVEISPNADPPVCKITDYKKFLYEQKKKQKEIKSNTVKSVIKEIRFGPNTGDHDVNFKMKHAQAFLSEGHKVRAFVFFKGRSIVHKDRGYELLMKFANSLVEDEYAKIELPPKSEGKKLIIVLAPTGKTKK